MPARPHELCRLPQCAGGVNEMRQHLEHRQQIKERIRLPIFEACRLNAEVEALPGIFRHPGVGLDTKRLPAGFAKAEKSEASRSPHVAYDAWLAIFRYAAGVPFSAMHKQPLFVEIVAIAGSAACEILIAILALNMPIDIAQFRKPVPTPLALAN